MISRKSLLPLSCFLVLALPSLARAETKIEVTGTPKKAEVALGEEIEVDVSVKNAGTEEADLIELVDDARSVSFEIKIDDAKSSAWDAKFQIEERPGAIGIALKHLGRMKLKPGEESPKATFKVPAIASGTWSITTLYAGTAPEKTLLAEVREQAALTFKKDAARTVKVLPGPNGETGVVAKMTTTHGTITFRFFPKDALATGLNFVRLARSGWYDGKSFHRIVQSIGVVQGGARNQDGGGAFDYCIPRELVLKHGKGRIAMARRPDDPNSADCQFYICANDNSKELDRPDGYAVFGEVTKGQDVVDTLFAVETSRGGEGTQPVSPLKIESVKIKLEK